MWDSWFQPCVWLLEHPTPSSCSVGILTSCFPFWSCSAFTRKTKLPGLFVFGFCHNSWQNRLATWNVPGNLTYKRGLLLIYLACYPCFFMEETARMYYIAWPVKQSSVLGLELADASCVWVRSTFTLFGVMWQIRHYSCEGKHPVL